MVRRMMVPGTAHARVPDTSLDPPDTSLPALDDDSLDRLAHLYLRRYGVVFRDILARECAPPWRELVRVYRALEARGAIRGGRFVQGFTGEQFALPEAVDALRAVRRARDAGAGRIELSASDPLNLAGIVTPGPRIPPGRGVRIVVEGGTISAAPPGVVAGDPARYSAAAAGGVDGADR